ncbi:hypothetical protein MJ588_12815 [Klebsiella pneumoniae]|nr:hypothetical protein MJ588_12815 [Klebsiella pneumoniae]
MPVLNAIHRLCTASRLRRLNPELQTVAPKIVRLDSMSLFDTGKWALKPASTKLRPW